MERENRRDGKRKRKRESERERKRHDIWRYTAYPNRHPPPPHHIQYPAAAQPQIGLSDLPMPASLPLKINLLLVL